MKVFTYNCQFHKIMVKNDITAEELGLYEMAGVARNSDSDGR